VNTKHTDETIIIKRDRTSGLVSISIPITITQVTCSAIATTGNQQTHEHELIVVWTILITIQIVISGRSVIMLETKVKCHAVFSAPLNLRKHSLSPSHTPLIRILTEITILPPPIYG
jgi:hypothetical protein